MIDLDDENINEFMEWLKNHSNESIEIKRDYEILYSKTKEEIKLFIIGCYQSDRKYEFSNYCPISKGYFYACFEFREFFKHID